MNEQELLKILGENIRRLRTLNGLSQQQLADNASIDRSFLTLIESGKKNISFETLASIISALDCRPVDLFVSPDQRVESLEKISISYAARTYECLQELVKDYRNMKTALLSMKGVLGDPATLQKAKNSDINIELLCLLPLLSDDAQSLLKRFAEGYLNRQSNMDETGKRIALEILGTNSVIEKGAARNTKGPIRKD